MQLTRKTKKKSVNKAFKHTDNDKQPDQHHAGFDRLSFHNRRGFTLFNRLDSLRWNISHNADRRDNSANARRRSDGSELDLIGQHRQRLRSGEGSRELDRLRVHLLAQTHTRFGPCAFSSEDGTNLLKFKDARRLYDLDETQDELERLIANEDTIDTVDEMVDGNRRWIVRVLGDSVGTASRLKIVECDAEIERLCEAKFRQLDKKR